MRVAVVGTSGLARQPWPRASLRAIKLPCLELGHLHWEPSWEALSETNSDEFVCSVSAAISGSDAWVSDGNYGVVRDLIWRRATHWVWLDYSRVAVIHRVIKRAIARAFDQKELWAGTREDWRRWLRSPPIQIGLEHVERAVLTA